jgi:Family of unknown function (DUF6421)
MAAAAAQCEDRVMTEAAARPFPRVLFDEAHCEAWSIRPDVVAQMNPRHPGDAGYLRAAHELRNAGMIVEPHTAGPLTDDVLTDCDVLVIAHPSEASWERVTGIGSPKLAGAELDAVEAFVRDGGGLVVLAECEQDKYGNNLSDLLARFGVHPQNVTVQDTAHNHAGVVTWVLGDLLPQEGPVNVLAGVESACFYRSGTLAVDAPGAQLLARTSAQADPPAAPLGAALEATDGRRGRVVVFADSDLFGDDSIGDYQHARLWRNAITWAARRPDEGAAAATPAVVSDPAWQQLTGAVATIRELQHKDGSLDAETHGEGVRDTVASEIDRCVDAITALRPRFEHDAAYLDAVVADLHKWRDAGFGVPDFLDSLLAFHPEQLRADGLEHLVVFPMYTQNGNPNRNLEAVVVKVVWPDWLAELEATRYDNAMFVPITFVDFTAGYDTNSAVLFPETVAVRETPRFTWGAIFCDREAARFRRVIGAAATTLRISLPPQAARLLEHQRLAQDTYVLWDLIHDRTHSHGELPFDPFMIKQRMPYWMYALEELRCDLNAFREAVALEADAVTPYAECVQYAVLFDRMLRFPITGERVRNYDGLGGQVLFGYLHKNGVVNWRDNRLSVEWTALPAAVVGLSDELERMYREGIDRPKVGHWLAGHEFVSRYVAPNPGSTWAKGTDALPLDGPQKQLVDLVLPDEFPLNVFFEALRRKLADVVGSTKGIQG